MVRTSINVPRELLTEIKIVAAKRNETMEKLFNDALREYLRTLAGGRKSNG